MANILVVDDEKPVRHLLSRMLLSILEKPFSPESLARKVREVLDD